MAKPLNVTANPAQCRFLNLNKRFRALVAGYGTGKSWAGCLSICKTAWDMPGMNQGYFAPTYGHIRDIFYVTIEECAEKMGLSVEVRASNKEVCLYAGGQLRSTVICRSMDRPHTIVGFKIAHAMIDELDVLPTDKARTAWRKIVARMRYQGGRNSIDVVTTPEGFRFTYEQFVRQLQDNPEMAGRYGVVQASTYENAHNLPDDYIPSLIEAYPQQLVDAYINGKFVNLTSGTVFRSYNREECRSEETVQERETLYIGMDFNITKMAAAIFVKRGESYHAVAEVVNALDTPDIIRVLQERWASKGHRIIIYPDATGKNKEAVDYSLSDLTLLRAARFEIRVKSQNPFTRDRVNAANKAFETGAIKVNDALCPTLAMCLEQQCYNTNGDPDKTTGFDHMNEAATYFVAYEMPINKPQTRMFTTSSR